MAKKVIDETVDNVVETPVVSSDLIINPTGLRFGMEDMNLLVDKLNEVIAYINK